MDRRTFVKSASGIFLALSGPSAIATTDSSIIEQLEAANETNSCQSIGDGTGLAQAIAEINP